MRGKAGRGQLAAPAGLVEEGLDPLDGLAGGAAAAGGTQGHLDEINQMKRNHYTQQ